MVRIFNALIQRLQTIEIFMDFGLHFALMSINYWRKGMAYPERQSRKTGHVLKAFA